MNRMLKAADIDVRNYQTSADFPIKEVGKHVTLNPIGPGVEPMPACQRDSREKK